MKKIIMILLMSGLAISCSIKGTADIISNLLRGTLPSVRPLYNSSEFANRDEIETEKAKIIIAAIQNKDFETLQSLFQPEVVESAETLYEDALALFDYITIDSYEITNIAVAEGGILGTKEDRKIRWTVYVQLKINGIKYLLAFIDMRENDAHKNEIGITKLLLIEDEKYDKHTIGLTYLEPGIFNPVRYESEKANTEE